MTFVFVNIMLGMYRGGGENYDLHLSRELARLGHDIEFYTLRPVFGEMALPPPPHGKVHPVRAPWLYLWTQRMHAVPILGRIRGLRGWPRALGEGLFELHVLFRLWRRRRETFVVHVCGLSFLSMLATKLLGSRVFVRFPGPPSVRTQRWFIRRTHAVIANGDAYNVIRREVPGANVTRIEVGVDHGLFKRTIEAGTARSRLGMPEGRVIALSAGRLVPIKNMQLLVQAMAHVAAEREDVDLAIAGDGPDRAPLEQLVRALNLTDRVHFLGELRGPLLREAYAASDMFVLASHYDNFPNVVVEAMAMELPVVATDVGGVASQVTPGVTGYLVPPGDARALASQMIRLAASSELRRTLGRTAGAEARRRFDWQKTAEEFLQLVGAGTSRRSGEMGA